MKKTLFYCGSLLLGTSLVSAAPLVSADFSAYADGDLVGQNGWAQTLSQVDSPIQVAGGKVTWAGGAVINEQDAFLGFGSVFTQPDSGTTTFYFGLRLAVHSAGDNPSYFAALDGATDGSSFENARLAARDDGAGGFSFGMRVNGQGGYPFAYGESLSYDTTYTVIAKVDLASGNQNDTISLYVNPGTSDLDSLTPYATAAYTTGSVTDPSYGAVILSQFGNASTDKAGVSINSLAVSTDAGEVLAVVPEPSTYAMLLGGLCALGLGFRSKRK